MLADAAEAANVLAEEGRGAVAARGCFTMLAAESHSVASQRRSTRELSCSALTSAGRVLVFPPAVQSNSMCSEMGARYLSSLSSLKSSKMIDVKPPRAVIVMPCFGPVPWRSALCAWPS